MSGPTPAGPSSAICVVVSPNSTFLNSILILGYFSVNFAPACLINSSGPSKDSHTVKVISSLVNSGSVVSGVVVSGAVLSLEALEVGATVGLVELDGVVPAFFDPHPATNVIVSIIAIHSDVNFFLIKLLLISSSYITTVSNSMCAIGCSIHV